MSFEESRVTRTFAADMILMYALDRADWLEYVSNGAIEQLGVSKEELHARAIEDLPNRLPPIEVHDCGGGVVGLSAGGSFEASLLLVDRLWQDLAKHLPGEPLAAVPARDLLFAIGSAQPRATELIAERAQIDLPDKRYEISKVVLIRSDGKWQAHSN